MSPLSFLVSFDKVNTKSLRVINSYFLSQFSFLITLKFILNLLHNSIIKLVIKLLEKSIFGEWESDT
jgi:hypothetical protein